MKIRFSDILVIRTERSVETERGTACGLRINGKRHLVFPGAVDDGSEYYPLAIWPEDIARPFPPSLPTGPSLPGSLITAVCVDYEGACFAWRSIDRPPLATGDLAYLLHLCFNSDSTLREPTAEELADIYPYGWLDGPKTWPPEMVLHAVLAIQRQFAAYNEDAIYGLGPTPEAAVENARRATRDPGAQFRTAPIDPEFAARIERDGFHCKHGMFGFKAGVLVSR